MPAPTAADLVIIGGGHGGAQLAQSLRKKGYSGSIVIVSDDPALPYDRPSLSKNYLLSRMDPSDLLLREADYWTDEKIGFALGVRAVALDRHKKQVQLDDGRTIAFQWCVLATGGTARKLSCEGADLAGIHYLRTMADVEAIRHDLAKARNVGIVGAGFVGLEVAAAAREMGLHVHIVEAQDRVLQRVTSQPVSEFFQQHHLAQGAHLHLSQQVSGFLGENHVSAIALRSGEAIEVDTVIVGIGIDANADLAAAAGLDCDNGIVVDAHFRTSDPNILAIGDCARHPNIHAGGMTRLESIQHALDSADIAADTIMGTLSPYQALPTFWSDQFKLRLQTAGLFQGADEIIERGGDPQKSLSVLYLKQGRLIAIDAINAPKDFMGARSLILTQAVIDKNMAGDSSIPLKKCGMIPADSIS